MKIKYLLTGISMMVFGSYAQTNIKGLKYLGFGGGATGLGVYGSVNYSRVMARNINLEIGLSDEIGHYKTVGLNVAQLYTGVDYYIKNFNDKHFLKIQGGGLATLNSVSNIEVSENVKKTTINYGAYILGGIDISLSNKVFMTPYYRQNFLFGKGLGSTYFQAGINLKIKLR